MRRYLELLHVYSEAALVAYLLAHAVRILLNYAEDMLVLFILPPLPDCLASSPTKLPQTIFKLLVFLFLLLRHSTFVFCVQSFWRAPFLPCKFFDLIPQE